MACNQSINSWNNSIPMANVKAVKGLLKKYNKNRNPLIAFRLSQILGYEPDTKRIYGTVNEPVKSLERIEYLKSLPVSNFF